MVKSLLYSVIILLAILTRAHVRLVMAQAEMGEVLQLGDVGGRPTVEVTIDGKGPFLFILDTGSPAMIVDDSLAHELGLEAKGIQRVGAPGSDAREATIYRVDDFRIGDYIVDVDDVVGIQDLLVPPGPRTYGIVSFWVIGRGTSELDLSQSTLRIRPDVRLDAEALNTLHLRWNPPFPFPTFPIKVGDRTIEAHLDTGSPDLLVVDGAQIDSVTLNGEPMEIGRARMVGRETVVRSARLSGDVIISDVTLHNPEIRFIDRIAGANVGSGLLRRGIVRVDHENDLISITPHSDSPTTEVQ